MLCWARPSARGALQPCVRREAARPAQQACVMRVRPRHDAHAPSRATPRARPRCLHAHPADLPSTSPRSRAHHAERRHACAELALQQTTSVLCAGPERARLREATRCRAAGPSRRGTEPRGPDLGIPRRGAQCVLRDPSPSTRAVLCSAAAPAIACGLVAVPAQREPTRHLTTAGSAVAVAVGAMKSRCNSKSSATGGQRGRSFGRRSLAAAVRWLLNWWNLGNCGQFGGLQGRKRLNGGKSEGQVGGRASHGVEVCQLPSRSQCGHHGRGCCR